MILVTGGTGFLGSELVKELSKADDVQVLSRRSGHVRGDVSDYDSVYNAVRGAEQVYHLAAESDHFAPYDQHFKTTVLGTENVMRAAEKTGAKIVYMGTAAIFSSSRTNYSRAKLEAEEIVKKYWETVNAPVLRASLIYDKKVLTRLKHLTYLPMPYKRQRINIAYIGTVVEALMGAMKYGKSEIYSVADKEPITMPMLSRELAGRRPILWFPHQLMWLPIALFYPVEKIAELVNVRPPMTASFIRAMLDDRIFNQKNLDYSQWKLKYNPVDTLETVSKLMR